MKTYIHKKLGWKAVQHTTPEYYKVYKSKTEDCYTLRSSLEIEDSNDWENEQEIEHIRTKLKEAENSGFYCGEDDDPKPDVVAMKMNERKKADKDITDAEILAELENRVDELSKKYEISLKFYSDLLALVERYKNKIGK